MCLYFWNWKEIFILFLPRDIFEKTHGFQIFFSAEKDNPKGIFTIFCRPRRLCFLLRRIACSNAFLTIEKGLEMSFFDIGRFTKSHSFFTCGEPTCHRTVRVVVVVVKGWGDDYFACLKVKVCSCFSQKQTLGSYLQRVLYLLCTLLTFISIFPSPRRLRPGILFSMPRALPVKPRADILHTRANWDFFCEMSPAY